MAVALWCPVCSGQTDEMRSIVPGLLEEGLAVLQLVIDGTARATAPDRCDVKSWIERKKTSFTVAFDPVIGPRIHDNVVRDCSNPSRIPSPDYMDFEMHAGTPVTGSGSVWRISATRGLVICAPGQ